MILRITKTFFKYTLLSSTLLFLTFCQNLGEDFNFTDGVKITKDSKIVSLMIGIANNGSNQTLAKTHNNQQCAKFLYPMTFKVFFGDNPISTVMTINSDAELLDFLTTLTGNTGFYINFPITLIDANGLEIVVNNLMEFEATLQTAVDVCTNGGGNGNDDNTDDNGNSDDDNHNNSDDDDHGSSDDDDHSSSDDDDHGSSDDDDHSSSDDDNHSNSDDDDHSSSDDDDHSSSDDDNHSSSDDDNHSNSDDDDHGSSDDDDHSSSDDDNHSSSDDDDHGSSDDDNHSDDDNGNS